MTTEDDFQRQLDERPDDHHTRMVFADWLDERGDPRAEGYRALGLLRLCPTNRRRFEDDTVRHWLWLEAITGRMRGSSVKSYWHCHMTKRWVDAPPGFHRSWAGFRVDYDTRREAEDDAALAWLKVEQSKRERDLREAVSR